MKSVGKPFIALAAVVVTGVVASLVMSIASLILAIQANSGVLPALAYDVPASAVVHVLRCTDPAKNNASLVQYDVEYALTLSNSGGRPVSLLHATVASGAEKDLPWPVALTDAPTNRGSTIDAGKATFVLPPASILPGQSRRMSVNGRLRLNDTNASQQETAKAIDTGGTLQLSLLFSNGVKKDLGVRYTVQQDDASAQANACAFTGDFHYHLDQS